jgi:hypothetical protein
MTMNAITFARSFGFTYVHTPFRFIRHAERPMEEWTAAWEALFNLGSGETACHDERRNVVDFCYNFTDLGRCFGSWWRLDELADRFRAMIPELRHKYYLNKSPRTADELTVAIHVRRGDVSAEHPYYFTSNEKILRTIATMKSVLDDRELHYRIRLYSQGQSAEFADFCALGIDLFLNADAVWTMQELIEADVLIMAKGCFSYCAGLLSDGIKFFAPAPWPNHDGLPSDKWCAFPLAENWITCQPDGSFDSRAFERQLLRHETSGLGHP